jgi:hypothetical protein
MAERRERVRQDSSQQVGTLFPCQRLELTGIEPYAAAVGTGLDLDSVELARGQVVPVLRALEIVRLSLCFGRRRLIPFPLLAEQLGILAGEVLVFISGFHWLYTLELKLFWPAPTIEVKNPLPPVRPSNRSAARSGWGMMPTTLPAALQIPAMWLADPLGLG